MNGEVMKRGRSQVIWRYAPGATFRYNDGSVWCYVHHVTLRETRPLTEALAQALEHALYRWKALGPTGFPHPVTQASKYAVGEPYVVWYDIWPTIFTCRKCGRVHFYRDLHKLKQVNDRLGCITCKGQDLLRQVPFAYICECGRLDSISMQKHDISHPIELVNKGTFQESYWRCKSCGKPLYRTPREGLGFRRCDCVPKKGMRGVLLEDSRVYYSQTIELVEIEPQVLEKWRGNQRFSDLLLAAVLHLPCYAPGHLLDIASWKQANYNLSPEMRAVRGLLISRGATEAEADLEIKKIVDRTSANPWADYDADLAPYRSVVGRDHWEDARRTVEYVFVRDEPSAASISIDTLISEAEDIQDLGTAERLRNERDLASALGLVNLRIVEQLPILLAGIGYTRYLAGPRDAETDEGASKAVPVSLKPYALQDGKIPIYVARNTTEALMYELDPWRVAAFLEANTTLVAPQVARLSEPAMRAWLLGVCGRLVEDGESHFVLKPFEQEAGIEVDEPSALAFGVLHTMSHVLKATAHRYVGIDADSLAEYLFPEYVAGLLYVSSHQEFTLGGIDSVFRANLGQWLGSARDYAGRCSFDPVCSQAGGACSACLYPKFGCAYFNRTLSRAFLFGGYVPGRTRVVQGFWSPAVAAAAHALRSVSL